jgi:hypothetical protein
MYLLIEVYNTTRRLHSKLGLFVASSLGIAFPAIRELPSAENAEVLLMMSHLTSRLYFELKMGKPV